MIKVPSTQPLVQKVFPFSREFILCVTERQPAALGGGACIQWPWFVSRMCCLVPNIPFRVRSWTVTDRVPGAWSIKTSQELFVLIEIRNISHGVWSLEMGKCYTLWDCSLLESLQYIRTWLPKHNLTSSTLPCLESTDVLFGCPLGPWSSDGWTSMPGFSCRFHLNSLPDKVQISSGLLLHGGTYANKIHIAFLSSPNERHY